MSNVKPSILRIFCVSIINGIASIILSTLVLFPLMYLVLLLFTWDFAETIDIFLDKLNVIIVIFSIGTVFEIIDRICRGISNSKILTIRRDKSDRW